MSTDRVIKWSGLISILGGLLFPLAAIVHPHGEDLASVQMAHWVPAHFLGWVAVTLMHLGLIGLYAAQGHKAAWLGLIGFVLAFLGSAFASTVQYVAATAVPLIATQAPGLFEQATTPPPFAPLMIVLGFVAGHVLFGLATIRAGVLPRTSGLLVMIGVILFFVGELSFLGQRLAAPSLQPAFDLIRHLRPIVLLGDAAFGLGIAWMGYAVWTGKRTTAR